jgi:beta-glucosidase
VDAKVGWTIANQNFEAEPGAEQLASEWAWSREDLFIDAAAEDDFIGVQAYTRVRLGKHGPLEPPQGSRTTLTGWEYYPQAMAGALRHTARRLPGVPMMVTENGIATATDAERIAYTSTVLAGIAEVIREGLDVRGYLHWSWLDNFEWGSYTPTFGLVSVDRRTFARTLKPSATWLGEMARTNGTNVLASA